jgi:hypothetical protein
MQWCGWEWEGGTSWQEDHAELVRQLDLVASSDGGVGQAVGVYSPPCSQRTQSCVGNMMALTLQRRWWARVPSTQLSGPVDPHTWVGPLVPEAPDGKPMASCSPVGGRGRLFPDTPESVSTGKTVQAPARMPAHSGASPQYRGGREGIDGTGVSRRPEKTRRIASFLYYLLVGEEIILLNHQPQCAVQLYPFFKRANGAMAASPPADNWG